MNQATASESGNDWLLWQIADSAFPTGGFAHSAGLEAAWQHGEVPTRKELVPFIEAGLHQLGRAALPFVTAAHDEPERLAELDQLCEAFTTNHVANGASRWQGRAFLTASERILKAKGCATAMPSPLPLPITASEVVSLGSSPFYAHFAPVFGAVTQRLDFPRQTSIRLFLFHHLRGLLAGAVRLNIVGPMEAQLLQHRLSDRAEEVASRCAHLSLHDLAQTAPLLDLWQGTHGRLYSRLFRS